MKRFAFLALVAGLGAACAGGPVDVSLDLPGIAVLPPGAFTEIIITSFAEASPPPEFAAGPELAAYLAVEIGRVFSGRVSRANVPAEAAAGPAPAPFWKEAGNGRESAVFLTGSVTLAGQVRKALDKSAPSDGPFNIAKRGLVEQRRWTLSVEIFLVSAATGEIVHRTSLREDRDYLELDKPADFAFSDLSARLRDRLFPALLGTPTIERRALLRR